MLVNLLVNKQKHGGFARKNKHLELHDMVLLTKCYNDYIYKLINKGIVHSGPNVQMTLS